MKWIRFYVQPKKGDGSDNDRHRHVHWRDYFLLPDDPTSDRNQITGNIVTRRLSDNRRHIQHHNAEHNERQENFLGPEIEELSHH